MRERAAATVAALTLAGILLINFKGPADAALVTSIKTGSSGTSAGTGTTTQGSTGTNAGTTGGSTSGGTTTGTSGRSSTAAGTYAGPVVGNPYGDVQVQITVANGKITDVQALSLPVGGHSGRISDYVAPRSEERRVGKECRL